MSNKGLLLWSCLVSVLTGALWGIGTLLLYLFTQYHLGNAVFGESLRFSSSLFLILTVVALYRLQVQQSGKMGFVSFILAILGAALNIIPEYLLLSALSGSSGAAIEMGTSSLVASIIIFTYVIGTSWFGIASFYSGILPKWGALLFIVGVILSSMPNLNEAFPHILLPVGAFLGGVGLCWMGWSLLKKLA